MTGNVEIFTDMVEVIQRKNIYDFKHVEPAQRNEEKPRYFYCCINTVTNSIFTTCSCIK